MKLPQPLISGSLIRRYKRFLVDVRLENREIITAHCPNSGSMTGLLQDDSPVLLSKSENRKRKWPFTLELIRVGETWVGVNTLIPNRLLFEAFNQGQITELSHYLETKREVKWADGCRLDFLLQNHGSACFVEAKNVTLAEDGVALFPDAKTERGWKHLKALMEIVGQGYHGVICFLVNRGDCHVFRPAHLIDPVYARTLKEAQQEGVQILVYRARIEPPDVHLDRPLAYELD